MPNINAADARHGSQRRRFAHAPCLLLLLLGCAVDPRRLAVIEDERARAVDAAVRDSKETACPDGPDCTLDASAPAPASVTMPAPLPSSLDTPDADTCDPADGGCLPPCDGCRIDGACIAAGLQNPDTLCQICDPARDPRAWSSNDGLVCDDGRYCTQLAACSAGECVRVLARDCGFDSCNEAQRRCVCSGDC
jgi:hypothetical protein